MATVNLALLWGHLPRGIIETTRHICRKYEREVPFALARDSATGKETRTIFHAFGSYHFPSSSGPFPVSLVELVSVGPNSIPGDVVSRLHAISIGFPIVGDKLFPIQEKFFNPVVSIPSDDIDLALQEWYYFSVKDLRVIREDDLTHRLIDGELRRRSVHESVIANHYHTLTKTEPDSEGRYIDHPESSHVRRDRGFLKAF